MEEAKSEGKTMGLGGYPLPSWGFVLTHVITDKAGHAETLGAPANVKLGHEASSDRTSFFSRIPLVGYIG